MASNKKPKKQHSAQKAFELAKRFTTKTSGDRPLSEATLVKLGLTVRASYEMIRRGQGHLLHVTTLHGMMLISNGLAKQEIGHEYASDLLNASSIINQMFEKGRCALDPSEVSVIEKALDVHEAQLAVATIGDLLAIDDRVSTGVRTN